MRHKIKSPSDLITLRESLIKQRDPRAGERSVRICTGGGCIASGALELRDSLKELLEKEGLDIPVNETGCMGPCAHGPVLNIQPDDIYYRGVTAADLPLIATEHLRNGRVVDSLLMDRGINSIEEKIVLRNCGRIDPLDIEDSIREGGYGALAGILEEGRDPESVIGELKKSGLRGRGGAGFPTWMKWDFTARADGEEKYVLCNGDEGDPGAFMDRSVLEGDPHTLIEGMLIAAVTIGAERGFIYVRAEYPLAVSRLQRALDQAREYGLLGSHILGSSYSVDLSIRMGSGAFVCGEETALINSIEGKRGEPRPRPPFPARKGLWGKPSLLNNVETYANIPAIFSKGADWYASFGTENSKGTKVFALAGAVRNTGLVEVPIGTPLGDLIFEVGGGIKGGKPYKAAQIGGPSGGCIPLKNLGVPLDYNDLKELGAIMGSGGLVVMDDESCMVDVARFFLEFVQEESCGKCVPCRVGTKRMLEILERIAGGEGREGDIDTLVDLGNIIKDTALCGLGQTAPNPVLSTIRHFRREYEDHILRGHCEAGVCSGLVRAPCQSACPASVDIPGFISLVGEGRYSEALRLHRERNPFAGVCARVCFHTCEEHCRRCSLDDAVSIRGIKRFMVDQEVTIQAPSTLEIKENEGRKIAVIGAGPAGLSCACFLARMGYRPDVFEASPRPGGMLVQTIPAYRLPRETLAREIRMIEHLGVNIITHRALGRDFTLESLKDEGYEAVFLGVGASGNMDMGLPGEDAPGVLQAIPFLKEYNIRGAARVGQHVAVVGGGNAAVDAARTALRLGAESVTIIYRRSRDAMPAYEEEIEDALEEGIILHCLIQPVEFLKNSDGDVCGVKCLPMTLGGYDSSGRRSPKAAHSRALTIPADQVILAVGQRLDSAELFKTAGPVLDAKGFIQADPVSGETGVPGLFAGGDAAEGPSSVVKAIAGGERAAVGIDRYLSGEDHAFWRWEKPLDTEFDPDAEPSSNPREKIPVLSSERRKASFEEVERSWNEHTARRQAGRCLRCDYGKKIRIREESHV